MIPKFPKSLSYILIGACLMAGLNFLVENMQEKTKTESGKSTINRQNHPNMWKTQKNTSAESKIPAHFEKVKAPKELSDSEIHFPQEKMDRRFGGDTPVRNSESIEEIVERKMEEGDWAMRNVLK